MSAKTKIVVALIIIAGAACLVAVGLNEPVDETREQAESRPRRLYEDSSTIPRLSLDRLREVFGELSGSISDDDVERKCQELILELSPSEKLRAPEHRVSFVERQRRLVRDRRWIVQEYLRATKDEESVRDEAAPLLLSLVRLNCELGNSSDRTRIMDRLRVLSRDGQGDPVLSVVYLGALKTTRGGGPRSDRLQSIALGLDESHSERFRVRACCSYLDSTRGLTPQGKLDVAKLYAAALARLLAPQNGDSTGLAELMETQVSNHLMLPLSVKQYVLAEWATQKPVIDDYFVQYLVADAAAGVAWLHRGNSYANRVTEEGWKIFGAEISRAALSFQKAWTLRPGLPYAPSRMIDMSRSSMEPGRSSREWFDITNTISCGFVPAFRSFRHSLLPRWGGSDAELYSFVEECLQTDAPHTLVPDHGMDCLAWYYEEEHRAGRQLWRTPSTVRMARLARSKVLAWRAKYGEKEDAESWSRVRGWSIALLMTNGLFEEAAPLVTAFQRDPPTAQMMSLLVNPGFCFQAVRAAGGRHGAVFVDVERRLSRPDPAFDREELKTLKDVADQASDDHLAHYMLARYEFARVLSAGTTGGSVRLQLDAPEACWAIRGCEVLSRTADAIEIRPEDGKSLPAYFASRIPLVRPYVLKARIQRTQPSAATVQLAVMPAPEDPAAVAPSYWDPTEQRIFELPPHNDVAVEVIVENDRVVLKADGEVVESRVQRKLSKKSAVWFGTRSPIRISNFTIQREL